MIPAEDRSRPGDVIAMALDFLSRCSTVRSELDQKSLESIRDRLKEIRDTSDRTVAVAWIVRLLLDMIERHTVEASSETGGRLYVVPLARAGYSSRNRLFIVGLDQESFRSSDTEDPFLLDVERTAISKHLVPMYRRAGDTVFQLNRAVGMVDSIVLTASVHDVTTGDTLHVAPAFQDFQDSQESGTISLVEEAGDADDSLDSTSLLLRYRSHDGYVQFMSRRWPDLARGRTAEQAREAVGVSHFDGWTTTLPPGEIASAIGPEFSASRIERLAACPYRYFLRDILRVRPPIREERDPTRWLSGLEFGRLLHEVFHDFLSELHRNDERVNPERHEGTLLAVLERQLRRYTEEVPVFNEAAKRADLRRLQRSLRVFLNAESRSEPAEPVGFEISFGQGRSDHLNRPDPIRLELGSDLAFMLNGKIDRVDRVDDGFIVIDYKTGSQYRYETGDLLNGGLNLQWALYALALGKLVEMWDQTGPVLRSGYYFASHKGNGRRIEERPPTAEELGRTLSPLFEMARQGFYPHVQKEGGQCTFCDFRAICQKEGVSGRRVFDLLDALEDDPRPFVSPLTNWIRGT
jgi:ATP-dependent helicase/nuclease subunit B